MLGSRQDRALATHSAALRASTRSAIQEHLVDIPLFSSCSKRELKLIARLARLEQRTTGASLTTQGLPGSEMYVLLQGTARVVRNGRKVADIGSGAVVGELSLLIRTPRNATVIATSSLEVAVLGSKEFAQLIKDAPGFDRKLLESLAQRMHALDTHAV